jgi:hypothetical protein
MHAWLHEHHLDSRKYGQFIACNELVDGLSSCNAMDGVLVHYICHVDSAFHSDVVKESVAMEEVDVLL